MKITNVRTMLLEGPDTHGVGGIGRTLARAVRARRHRQRRSTASAKRPTSSAIGEGIAYAKRVAHRQGSAGDQPVRSRHAVRRPAAVRPADEPDGHGGRRRRLGRERDRDGALRSRRQDPQDARLQPARRRVPRPDPGLPRPQRRGRPNRHLASGGRWRSGSRTRASPTTSSTPSGSPRSSASDPWNRQMRADQVRHTYERLAAVREVAGPDAEIALDGHMSFDVETAIRLARALEPLNLKWFEDPVPIINFDAQKRVRDESPDPDLRRRDARPRPVPGDDRPPRGRHHPPRPADGRRAARGARRSPTTRT